jgi:hypothetical protein
LCQFVAGGPIRFGVSAMQDGKQAERRGMLDAENIQAAGSKKGF